MPYSGKRGSAGADLPSLASRGNHMEEHQENIIEGTLEDLCQELLPLTVGAEESAQTSEQPMEVSENIGVVERAACGTNLPTDASQAPLQQRPKKLGNAAKGRLRALIGIGVSPQEATQLATKSFAELKKMGYKFGSTKSTPEQKSIKRPRSEEESPKGNPPKAPRVSETPPTQTPSSSKAYSEVVSQIRVGIKDSSPMSDAQLGSLCNSILQKISTMEKGEGPSFNGYSLRPGWLLITCGDQRSKTWLTELTPSLKPWPEANLAVIPENELPKPNIGMVFIPEIDSSKIEQSITLLRVQNQGLHSEFWRVIHSKAEKGGVMLTLSLDDQSVETLKKLELKANLGFRKVHFRLKGSNKAQQSEVETTLPPAPLKQNPDQRAIPGTSKSTTTKVLPKPKRVVPVSPSPIPASSGSRDQQRFPHRGASRSRYSSRGKGLQRGTRQGHSSAQHRPH